MRARSWFVLIEMLLLGRRMLLCILYHDGWEWNGMEWEGMRSFGTGLSWYDMAFGNGSTWNSSGQKESVSNVMSSFSNPMNIRNVCSIHQTQRVP
jgi:hypothetical protein